MVDSILKEAKDLFKDKESENTWFKIFGVFDKLLKHITSKDDVTKIMPQIADLLIRSLQSDRSRLNGISLDFLKKCAEIGQKDIGFNAFLPILIKLTGKSSKVFVNRAMDVLVILCKYPDLKCTIKSITDFIDNPNKNVRFAVYKIIEIRINDSRNIFEKMVEKGLKDPSQEVRNICKGVGVVRVEQPVVAKEIKKSILLSATPRKNIKLDTAHAEIKKLEDAVMKIAKEPIVNKPISSDFFEKLNLLKKERKFTFEKRDDDLTPRKLDRYLNKYRSVSPQNIPNIITKVKPDIELPVLKNQPVKTENPDLRISFIHETSPFKREMGSPVCKENSIVHKTLNESIPNEIPGSDHNIQIDIPESNVVHLPYAEIADISNISHSFANMSIEPSFHINETIPEMARSSAVMLQREEMRMCDNSLIINDNINEVEKDQNSLIIDEYETNEQLLKEEMRMHDMETVIKDDNSIIITEDVKDQKEECIIHEVDEQNKPEDILTGMEIIQEYEIIKDEKTPADFKEDDIIALDPSNNAIIDVNQTNNCDTLMVPEVCADFGPISYNPIQSDNFNIIAEYENSNEHEVVPESVETKRSDVSILYPPVHSELCDDLENNINIKNLSKISNSMCSNIVQKTLGYTQKSSYLDKICMENEENKACAEIEDPLISLGNFDENIASFIEKLSKPMEKNTQNATFCISNLNDTIMIDSVQNKDPSDIFLQQPDHNAIKHSCVDLFNEQIFCSDEEILFTKKSPILKERPSFSIDVTLEPYCDEQTNIS